MNGTENVRMVLLGKTGAGKSSLANTIFGEQVFPVNHSINSETKECQAMTTSVGARNLTVIDTPGFFDTDRPEEELKPEIVRCITECAPGPHAFLIVLKAEKFTEHEQAVVEKICTYFTNDVLKYAVVVFTHGDQLPDGMNIQEFVSQNKLVSELVKRCGERCHIIDNKYWNNNQEDAYRNNRFQVNCLLQTLDTLVVANNKNCYTNEMLQAVEKEIEEEEENIRLLGNTSEANTRKSAKVKVFEKLLIRFAGIGTGVLLGAIFGVVVMVGAVLNTQDPQKPIQLKSAAATAAAAMLTAGSIGGALVGGVAGLLATVPIAVTTGVSAAGALKGAIIGKEEAEGAKTPKEAAQKTLKAVKKEAQSYLNKANNTWNKMLEPEPKTSEEEEEKPLLESQNKAV
ncbi:GTPase IMAP family member 7-like [Austrofundulus limnaeus]|uniref:GTPase IMAP family member 7-like n=1 Tax=Austrofundulus limnaeus TaxID=52670 RepID=A0A2I4BY67_AUSLI|nr:PREDICTED: GTPase IMAP family member 7-like [Austrofundulus limnaeus]